MGSMKISRSSARYPLYEPANPTLSAKPSWSSYNSSQTPSPKLLNQHQHQPQSPTTVSTTSPKPYTPLTNAPFPLSLLLSLLLVPPYTWSICHPKRLEVIRVWLRFRGWIAFCRVWVGSLGSRGVSRWVWEGLRRGLGRRWCGDVCWVIFGVWFFVGLVWVLFVLMHFLLALNCRYPQPVAGSSS